MTIVEVTRVARLGFDEPRVRGFDLDAPRSSSGSTIYSLLVQGWVLGGAVPARQIEVMENGQRVQTADVHLRRPDVATHYGVDIEASGCGFSTRIGVLGFPPQFKLTLTAVLEDETRVPLAVIEGHHRSVKPARFRPSIQPLMVTMLGRVGSTWLMRLLSMHRQVVVEPSHPYETRAASYWMQTLKVLTHPADHGNSSPAAGFQANHHWIGHNPFNAFPPATDARLRRWLGKEYVERLAGAIQGSIDGFYREVTLALAKSDCRYFGEKYHPDHIPWMMWELYPEAREIFLVRDLRDVLTSVLAFNRKRGYSEFGREAVSSDVEYVERLKAQGTHLLREWEARADRALLVRYEDLVTRPQGALESILKYLGLESGNTVITEMLRLAREDTSELRGHRTSTDPAASIGRWERDLPRHLRDIAETRFVDVMSGFGYGAGDEDLMGAVGG
jgi:Sulfotransferase family